MPRNDTPRKRPRLRVSPDNPQLQPGDLTRMAEELECTPSHLSRVLSGQRSSERLSREIKRRYGVHPSRLRVAEGYGRARRAGVA